MSNFIDEEEDFGDISKFERPNQLDLPQKIAESPTYYAAWNLATQSPDSYEILSEESSIPFGSGAFEAWWTGSTRELDSYLPSPHGIITEEDIHAINKKDPEEILAIFSNLFYNRSITTGITPEALNILIELCIYNFTEESAQLLNCEESEIFDKCIQIYSNNRVSESTLRFFPTRFKEIVNPTSGYISEDPLQINPASGYISNTLNKREKDEEEEDESAGDVSSFPEPTMPPAALNIFKATNYVDALRIFEEDFEEFNTSLMTIIPFGSGAFEAWWCGEEPDPKRFPDAVESPHRRIIKSDIDQLLRRRDGWGITGTAAISLFSNIFYNGSIAKEGIDVDVLEYLFKRVIELAYNEEGLDENGEIVEGISSCIDTNAAKELLDADNSIDSFVHVEVREFLRNRV